MKPRIFVSSTFYDLKYVREDISNFIKAHDFEPIMFEDGDIGYTPGKALDTSCYETMKSADMVVLIIGGNYGSRATKTSNEDGEFDEYISVTRKEFQTAVEQGLPIFTFIESSVYSEYNVYELNREHINQSKERFKFSSTKDINVFSFISEIKSIGNISITEFSKPSEIKDFLGKQWSDMFKNYLKFLREQEEYKKTHDSIDELKSAINEMQILVNGMFEKTFNQHNDIKYDSLKDEQRMLKASGIAKFIINNIKMEVDEAKCSNEKVLYGLFDKFIGMLIELGRVEGSAKEITKAKQIIIRNDKVKEFMINSQKAGIIVNMINSYLFDESFDDLEHDDKLRKRVVEILVEEYSLNWPSHNRTYKNFNLSNE